MLQRTALPEEIYEIKCKLNTETVYISAKLMTDYMILQIFVDYYTESKNSKYRCLTDKQEGRK